MGKRPAVKILIPYLAGIMLADRLDLGVVRLWVLSAVLVVPIFVAHKRRWLSTGSALLVLLFLCVGFLRHDMAMTPPQGLDGLLYQHVAVRGTVVRSQEERSGGSSLVVAGEAISAADPSVSMVGRISIRSWEEVFQQQYGDVVEVEGQLTQPRLPRNPGAFDYRKYLVRRGIFATMTVNNASDVQRVDAGGNAFLRWTHRLRGKIEAVIDETMPPEKEAVFHDIDLDWRLYAGILCEPSESASILKGITLGDRTALSDEMYQTFLRTSTSHILAVSGLHVGIVVLWTLLISDWIRRLMRLSNKSVAYILPVLLVIVYACMIGFKTSIVRASVLVILAVIAAIMYRDTDIFNLLAVAALGILIYRPGAIFDAGFQLSFGAVASIAYLMPHWESWLARIRGVEWYRRALYRIFQSIAVSWSAQIGAMLIIAHVFSRASLAGVFVNPIVIPLVALIVPLGFVSYLIGMIYLPLAAIPGYANHILISMLNSIVSWFAGFRFSDMSVKGFSFWHIVFSIAVIVFIANLSALLKQRRRLIIAGAAFVAVFIWAAAFAYDGRSLRVTYLDVGQGDSIFVDLPNGDNILIDGGYYSRRFDTGQRVVSPFLEHEGVSKLDLIVSTHPHNDHAGGLTYTVDNFRVDEVITGGYGLTTPTYEELLTRLDRNGIRHRDAQAGVVPSNPESYAETSELGADNVMVGSSSLAIPILEGARVRLSREKQEISDVQPGTIFKNKELHVEVVGPICPDLSGSEDSRMNNNSVVLKVTYKGVAFLFTGDIAEEYERLLVSSGRDIRATILKVPHQGSKTSSSWEFLRAVQPTIGVVSVGRRNMFRHPSPLILGRYRWLGIETYRTDKKGAITVVTDGRCGWIRTMRGQETTQKDEYASIGGTKPR